jgi:hypothetical protein
MKLHPHFGKQEPAAALFDHIALNVQYNAAVKSAGVGIAQDRAKPNERPICLTAMLADSALNGRQFLGFGQTLEAISQPQDLDPLLAKRAEERVRPVNRVDPNDRPEPTPFSFFDLSDRLFVLTLVNRLGFSERPVKFARIWTEGFYDPLKEFFVRGAALQKLIEPPQSFGCIPVA